MRSALLACLAVVATLASAGSAASASGPLVTALIEPDFVATGSPLILERARDAGATAVRLPYAWSAIAPTGAQKPPGFDATDPASPFYDWSWLDQLVLRTTSRGLAPIISIVNPPDWATVAATPGAERTLPDPDELGAFALAAARRYAGSAGGLPRVRYWQVWNEPNISLFFQPQFVDGQPFSPGWYRSMVNEMADAVKSVHADNFVIAGGTAPFFDNTPEVTAIDPDWGPLSFARHVLCLSESLTPTCNAPVRFDIWAHNPYTSGGPERHATLGNDVSIGDLPELRAVLTAAEQAGHVVSSGPVALWVTEFSWDSNPPDPNGVPQPLLTRWIAEALYRMWTHGVSLVTWFTLHDYPLATSPYQAGLYFRGATLEADTPKPSLQAFRFPFFAQTWLNGARYWARTPRGRQANVVVQQEFKGGWADLGTVASDQHGIVQGVIGAFAVGKLRARTADFGELSVPFAPRLVPDRTFHPFGGGPLEPDPPPPPAPPPPAIPPRPAVGTQSSAGPAPPPTIPARPALP